MHRSAVRQVAINFSASGDNTIVTAPASGPINVYGLILTVHAATNIIFKHGATAASGAIELTAVGSSLFLGLYENPWYWTLPGENFIINSSAAVQVSGTCWYTLG